MRSDNATNILVCSLALILTASLTCAVAQATAGPPPATSADPRTTETRVRSAPESAGGAGDTAAGAQYTLSLSGTGGTVTVDGTPHELPWSGAYDAGTTVYPANTRRRP
jgi:hypothetical protein